MDVTKLGLRSFQAIRLQFIEAMLIEHGFISRKILTSALGIEVAMASRDMALYSTLNSTASLNHSTKRWEAKPDFKPTGVLGRVCAADYLAAAGVVFGFKLGDIPSGKTEFGVIK
ncbi:hypothetical protein [Enterobacter kobei]|uniref:hypothetical protein n=1 Tax=Enterobacter kobei TaxID=208224 RepID=UPI0021C1D791|nr:hypothetical protein [Enterobacter kobei]UXJ66704.1 hypothetical protein N5P26_22810 [Enterobacter kobei]